MEELRESGVEGGALVTHDLIWDAQPRKQLDKTAENSRCSYSVGKEGLREPGGIITNHKNILVPPTALDD